MNRWRPFVTVASVVVRDGRFLTVEERPGNGATRFNQPAGHLEPGERILAAAHRELREETAWQARLDHYLGLYVYAAPDGKTFHSHGFFGQATTRLDSPLDPAIVAVHWLTLAELEALARDDRLRSPLVLRRVRDALAGHHHPLRVLHDR